MTLKLIDSTSFQNKSEYIVEFECISKLRVSFETISDLSKDEIVERASSFAQRNFQNEGILITERIARDHAIAFTAVGIDAKSANILNHVSVKKPYLRIVKSDIE